jgi:glutamyl-tRNA synthetase
MDIAAAHPFDTPVVTRFAPSPTGELHLGNARTALFNWLLARRAGGRFILRIEDTDTERSQEQHARGILEDLRWLGIDWDAGPDREDERGPYHQSRAAAIYSRYLEQLVAAGIAYPCFCTPLELEASRLAQRAAGMPPRYSGTCRDLSEQERASKRAQGLPSTLRFRVPPGRRIEFVDLVHGPQSFLSDDIGDFVIARGDGSAAFFFSNALDDARMGVTCVMRGEDHLANTPRQLLILETLGLQAPAYGHLPLIFGPDATPLSKRHGAVSLRQYRVRGYRPLAITNHLFRLGHSSAQHGLLSLTEQAAAFDPAHLGKAPARFDDEQLTVWQREAVHHLSPPEARGWLDPVLPHDLEESALQAFITAVLPNVVLPEDARTWVEIVFGEPPPLDSAEEQLVRQAGTEYFSVAAQAAARSGNDLPAIAGAVRAATGRKGAELYMPLRVALTGRAHGPELAPLIKAMPPGKTQERLARFAA